MLELRAALAFIPCVEFQPFDRHEEVRVHRQHLPHWRQGGVTYFITFRLADSLPVEKLRAWREERQTWLRVHGLHEVANVHTLPEIKQREFHQRFAGQLNAWLDAGYGSCRLRDPSAARIVGDALVFFDEQRYRLGTWIVMPNHVHALVMPLPNFTLGKIVQSWKSFTARAINKRTNRTGEFWQRESYDHIVRHEEAWFAFSRYIRENPMKARLKEGEYLVGEGEAAGR